VIGGEASQASARGIAAGGECQLPWVHALVLDQRQIEVRDHRKRQLEPHLRAVLGAGLEMAGQFREKDWLPPRSCPGS